MSNLQALCFFFVGLLYSSLPFCYANDELHKPIIGIFTTISDFPEHFTQREYSYIKYSYAEMVEEGGGIPIIIPWDVSDEDLTLILDSINGVVFTGGDADLSIEDPETGKKVLSNYTLQAKKVVDYAIKINNNGDKFPVFGVCQGPQVITMAISEDADLIEEFDHDKEYDYVLFGEDGRKSKMFSLYPPSLFDYLENKKVMYFVHELGLTPSKLLSHPKLNDFFNIVATSTDSNKKEFISALEGKNLPFYLTQYHPENILQECKNKGNLDREQDDFKSIFFLAKYFINEAKKSSHRFPEDNEILQRYQVKNGERVYLNSQFFDVFFYRSGDVYPQVLNFETFHLLRKLKLA